MMAVLIQSSPIDGVRERFTEGGSYTELMLALVVIAAFFVLSAVIQRVQQRGWRHRANADPYGLFRKTIRHLRLPVIERDVLMRMSRDLNLHDPTTLLLSPRLFRDRSAEWLTGNSGDLGDRDQQVLRNLTTSLFGEARE
jgi:hypothetical protein